MKSLINRIISFLIAFLLFSLNILNTVSIFGLDTFMNSDIVVINTIIDNKESLLEYKKNGLHSPIMNLKNDEKVNDNVYYSNINIENIENVDENIIIENVEENIINEEKNIINEEKNIISDEDNIILDLDNSMNEEDVVSEDLNSSNNEEPDDVRDNIEENVEDIELEKDNNFENSELDNNIEFVKENVSVSESSNGEEVDETSKETVLEDSTNKNDVESKEETVLFQLDSNEISPLSDTIEIGGNIYNIADFHNMDEFLLAAYIISNDEKYDLIAGETPSDMNIYLDFDVELTLQFATSSSLTRLNKLYAWEFTGITVGNPIDGQLLGDDGTVYGDYHIGSDGKIYAVLNDEGVSQSFIKWNLAFSGLWNNTNGDSITIDLGNGNIVTIQLDKSKGFISKENEDGDVSVNEKYDRGKTNMYYYSVIETYTDVVIESVSDILYFPYGYEEIQAYLDYSGKTLEEVIYPTKFKFEITDTDGVESEYDIPEENITVVYGNDKKGGTISFDITLPDGFYLSYENENIFKYRYYIDSEFFEFYHMSDGVDMCWKNDISFTLEDEEVLTDTNKEYMSQKNTVEKFMYLDNYNNGEEYVNWAVQVWNSDSFSISGYVITDTLSNGFEYLFPYDGAHYSMYLDGSAGYKVGYASWVECLSQEEFDSLTAETFPIKDGSVIYWYQNQFKYYIPELIDGKYVSYLWLEYCTNYQDILLEQNGYLRANHAIAERNGLFDETELIEKPVTFKKTNTGINIDDSGNMTTVWNLDWFIPANHALTDFHFEDYVPYKILDNGDVFIDQLLLNDERYNSYYLTSIEEVQELGINFTIKTEDGTDITDDILGYFVFKDYIDTIKDGEYIPYIRFIFTDKISMESDENYKNYGGFSAYSEDLYIHMDFPMTLTGNSIDFKNHYNTCNWYYNDWSQGIRSESLVRLPNYNNDEFFRKEVVEEELSEDGTELILTYEVYHNIEDYREGEGFTYKDIIEDTNYARYIEDSLEVFWVEDINAEELVYYEYPFPESPYAWEKDLLKIGEEAIYYIDSDQDDEVTPKYISVPFVTIQSSSDMGFELNIPYYGRTHNYCWYSESGSRRYYSPKLRYKVALNIDKLLEEEIYRYSLKNNISVYYNTGEIESSADCVYEYKNSVLNKQMIQVPDKTNKYTAKYEVIIEANNPLLDGINRIHLIDEMTKDMNLLTDSVLVEYSDDNLNWKPLDEDLFRLLYDSSIHTMTCIIDNDVVKNYYRVSYDVRVIGLSGQTVTISNNAHISGFKNVGDDISNDITIVQPEGNVEADMTEIVINKYDADNLELKLQGAEFELYTIRVLTAEELELLNSFSSKEEVLDYINNQMTDPWVSLSSKTTDENGQIIWRNHEDGLLLPLNTLLKVEEKSVPDGYFSSGEVMYFFLSVDKGASAERLAGKYITYFECRDHIANIFIANKKGSFTIQKVDGNNNKLLYGAEFGLYSDFECTNLIENSIDYDNGLYYFPALTLGGTYYLKELKAPANYKLDEIIYTVTVGEDGLITISPDLEETVNGYFIFENYYDTIESDMIPNTGGNGYKFRYIGVILILLSVGIVVIVWNKKNKK